MCWVCPGIYFKQANDCCKKYLQMKGMNAGDSDNEEQLCPRSKLNTITRFVNVPEKIRAPVVC
jgi:hypothetical protein